MKLSSSVYDTLKWVVLIALPAVSTLVVGLGALYNWSFTSQLVGTLTLITTFLGSLVKLSNNKYNQDENNFDGFLTSNGQDPDTGLPNLQMTITSHPDEILAGKTARLKIKPPAAA